MNEITRHTRMEKLLLEAARTFNSTLEYEELIELILRLVISAVDAEAAMVFRRDAKSSEMRIRFMNCTDCKMISIHREHGAGVVGWVAEQMEPLIINNGDVDERLDRSLENELGLKVRSVIALPLIGRGKMIGVVEALNKREGEFNEEDLDVLTGLNNQIAVALDNANLYREVRREALEKDLLYEIGNKLSGTLELNEVLKEIMVSLKKVVEYDVGGIYLTDGDSVNMDEVYSVGYDESVRGNLEIKCNEGLVGAACSSGEAVIVSNVEYDDRYIRTISSTKSEIVVPIKLDDRVIGVVNLESAKLNAYEQRELNLINTFAIQAAVSIERARLHARDLERRSLDEQLNVARTIQRTFLPKADPEVPGYDITGTNVSSGQVGGDYYDFVRIIDSNTGISIADVSGKGMAAALIMASFRASLIAEIRNNYSIRTICEKVNSLLAESLDPGNYVTGVYGVLDSRNHILTFSNFGHNPPILLRQDGQVEYLTEGGMILGVMPATTFDERALMLFPGEVIAFFTDGVTEVFDEAGREFGSIGVLKQLQANHERPATEICNAILEAVKAHASPGHVFDDLTMIIVKRLPEDK